MKTLVWTLTFLLALSGAAAQDSNTLAEPQTSLQTSLTEPQTAQTTITVLIERNPGSTLNFGTSLNTAPVTIATVTPEQLQQLQNNPAVKAVHESKLAYITLSTSVPAVKGDAVWSQHVNGISITGAGQSVCVIDTGIDSTHPSFAGKVVAQKCYCSSGGTGCCPGGLAVSDTATDDHGHGTHVAGIVAGNAAPVIGVAKDASIVAVKVCNAAGSCTFADMASAIDYCTTNKATYNISVITMSLGDGGAYPTQASCPTAIDSVMNAARAAGILITAASGNGGSTTGVDYPGCAPSVTSVGATSRDGTGIAGFSNRGPLLDVMAPGAGIVAARAAGLCPCSACIGPTTTCSGTSMATPHVAGIGALLAQHAKLTGKTFNPLLAEDYLKNTSVSVSSFRFVDALASLVLQATGITYNATNTSLTNSFAGLLYRKPLNVSRVQQCVNLTYNNASVLETVPCSAYYNFSATVRLNSIPISPAPIPHVNGIPCLFPQCDNVSLSTARVQFDVSHFTSYSAKINTTTSPPSGSCTVGDSGHIEIMGTKTCATLNKDGTFQPAQCVSYTKTVWDGKKYVTKTGTFCDDAVTDYSCNPGSSSPVLKRARTCTGTCTPRSGAGLQAVNGTSSCKRMGGWSPDCFSYWNGISWDSKCDDGKTDYTCGTVGKSTTVQLLKQDVICA